MNKQEIFKLMSENPVFHLATMENDQPRVRGMLLFRADEDGIVFHTASTKDVFNQIMKNPKAELCFNSQVAQVRVSGILELVEDEGIKEEIFNHPSRQFLSVWKDNGINVDEIVKVFKMKNGEAVEWTMATNFDEKEPVSL
ncbi:MAG: pyridoxamine 5'-phosphate oxidase family protein [Clostridium sp.]